MRTVPALVVAVGLLISVSACGSAASDAAGCTPGYASGAASESIEAHGPFGVEPSVSFPKPLHTDGNQVTLLDEGDGPLVRPGGVADFQVTAFNAKTGDAITSSSYDESRAIRVVAGSENNVLGTIVECAPVGSRLVATTTVTELFGDTDVSQYNVAPDDTIVLVVDVQRGFPGKADGVDQFPLAGFPSIALAPNGQPGLTIPSGAAPTTTAVEVLKAGSGATVAEGDHVVVHFTAATWDPATVFATSWNAGTPVTVLAASLTDAEGGLAPGLADALIGQRVGTQFVAVIAPEDGYPAGSAPAGVTPGATLVFVVDVLGII